MAIPITITRMPRPLFSAGVANYIWVTFATSSGSAEKNDVVISDVRPFVQPNRPVPGGISELACGGISYSGDVGIQGSVQCGPSKFIKIP